MWFSFAYPKWSIWGNPLQSNFLHFINITFWRDKHMKYLNNLLKGQSKTLGRCVTSRAGHTLRFLKRENNRFLHPWWTEFPLLAIEAHAQWLHLTVFHLAHLIFQDWGTGLCWQGHLGLEFWTVDGHLTHAPLKYTLLTHNSVRLLKLK